MRQARLVCRETPFCIQNALYCRAISRRVLPWLGETLRLRHGLMAFVMLKRFSPSVSVRARLGTDPSL